MHGTVFIGGLFLTFKIVVFKSVILVIIRYKLYFEISSRPRPLPVVTKKDRIDQQRLGPAG